MHHLSVRLVSNQSPWTGCLNTDCTHQDLLWQLKPAWNWSYTWGEFTERETTSQIILVWNWRIVLKKIIKCAVSTYSRSTKAWLKNAAVWHSRWKPCLLHYTFVPAVYMTKFKGAVHPKIKNTYFSLTCSVVYPSRVLEISAVELSALMI